jgi:hypothetical protein
MERSDNAVLQAIERDILQPDVVTTSLRKALARLQRLAASTDPDSQRVSLEKRLSVIQRDSDRLTAAITAGVSCRR